MRTNTDSTAPLTLDLLRTLHAEPAAAPAPAPKPTFRTGAPAPEAPKATKPQADFIRTLLAERAGHPDAEAIRADLNAKRAAGGLTKSVATAAITDLKAIPKTVTTTAPADGPAVRGGAHADIPDGYYAVPNAVGTNDLDFLLVETDDKEGDWKGFRSVTRIVGGNNYYPVKGEGRRNALKAIREATYVAAPRTVTLDDGTPVHLPARDLTGPEAAALRYADEIGRCRICNRNLTREESRIAGIGPICRGK